MRIPELTKRPNEMFAIGLQYVSPDLGEGEEVVSCLVSISPDEPSGLQKSGSPVIEVDRVSQIVYSGEDGREYYVTFKTATSGGNVYEDFIFIKVRSIG
ncbi:hypothetical protein ACFL2J_05570 [Candidatus Omnitrophota bacterium]